ncbi:diguanylate cyclase [Marinomonas mediterranea MMB-1]|uniref:diguanylate cyclase n=2 Tax=Marinomonas mediterranea TaxID=119864 RepID=F2JWB7_MARM1|nr:diguanylate cyclase [Marinomonas mediterranea MMB-1]
MGSKMKWFASVKNENALSSISAEQRGFNILRIMIFGCTLIGLFFCGFFWILPPISELYIWFCGYFAIAMALLLLYSLITSVENANKLELGIQLISLSTFSPLTWFYVGGAWLGTWRLIDMYPPISGMVLVAMSLSILFSHSFQFRQFILLLFLFNTIPVLSYLAFHMDELVTLRGVELMTNFGPMMLLLIFVLPYQMHFGKYVDTLRNRQKRTEHEAERDYLTDLYNRRGFENRKETLASETQVATLLVDADHFKHINDTFGHTVGDKVLVELASKLRGIYLNEHFVVRWGGEEFLVLIVNPDPEQLKAIADDFHASLCTEQYRAIAPRALTVSIGVSNMGPLSQFEALFEQADHCLYKAKERGRNQVRLFSQETNEFGKNSAATTSYFHLP